MNIRQAVVSIALSALLYLAMTLSLPMTAVFASGSGFMLTGQSLERLSQDGLPPDAVNGLKPIKDHKFTSVDVFLDAVSEAIGSAQTNRYSKLILQHASEKEGLEHRQISEVLKEQRAAINALHEQNTTLMKRIADLEATEKEREQDDLKQEETEAERERRLRDLETMESSRDDAARTIVRSALSTVGSKINEFMSVTGSIAVLQGAKERFQGGPSENVLAVNTADLDFEIQSNNWSRALIVFKWDEARDLVTADRAFATIGDTQRFPIYMTVGRIIAPFGIAGGNFVSGNLTINDPVTIEVFETKENAVVFGFEFPSPPQQPITPPVTPPPVRPLLLNPILGDLFKSFGVKPRAPAPPTPVTPTPPPPLLSTGVYFFNGKTQYKYDNSGKPADNYGVTVGLHTRGHCGRSYDQLEGSFLCPWGIDVDIDYIDSVFDSLFLESGYQGYLRQIKKVPGAAAHIKTRFGPVSLIGEWNGAMTSAKFNDDRGNRIKITPSAWQASLSYQFDWNPWVETIGAQGNYVTVGYSESRDLGGVTQTVGSVPTRVGFVPKKRFLIGAGEWFLDNLKFAVEYSYEQDYPKTEGGTGNHAHGLFAEITLNW